MKIAISFAVLITTLTVLFLTTPHAAGRALQGGGAPDDATALARCEGCARNNGETKAPASADLGGTCKMHIRGRYIGISSQTCTKASAVDCDDRTCKFKYIVDVKISGNCGNANSRTFTYGGAAVTPDTGWSPVATVDHTGSAGRQCGNYDSVTGTFAGERTVGTTTHNASLAFDASPGCFDCL